MPDKKTNLLQRLRNVLADYMRMLALIKRGWRQVKTPSGQVRYIKFFTENTIRICSTLDLAEDAERDNKALTNLPKNSPW